MVLEIDYDNNRNKPALSALRIAHVGSPAQPGPSRGLVLSWQHASDLLREVPFNLRR
jgi:hypothetical protein